MNTWLVIFFRLADQLLQMVTYTCIISNLHVFIITF